MFGSVSQVSFRPEMVSSVRLSTAPCAKFVAVKTTSLTPQPIYSTAINCVCIVYLQSPTDIILFNVDCCAVRCQCNTVTIATIGIIQNIVRSREIRKHLCPTALNLGANGIDKVSVFTTVCLPDAFNRIWVWTEFFR